MKKIFLMATILVVFLFVPRIVFGAVVINEVLYDPDGVDSGKEYIRLYNNGDSAIDLTNWDLDPSDAAYFTFPSFTLTAKSFVNIHVGASGINTDTDLYNNGSANMSNTKGPIALFNSTTHSKTTIIDYIEYGAADQTNESKAVDAEIWTTGQFIPDALEGKAIKLKTDGADNNSPNDWEEAVPSLSQEETPQPSQQQTNQEQATGTTNKPPIPDAGDNIIAFINQEIKFDGTKSTDPESGELAYSWNMGDGKLIEKPVFTYKYTYPGTYLVTLMVYDGLYYVFDTITVKIQIGQITINEFLPNPSGKDEEDEWIEIYNDSDSIVDISNWQLDDAASGSAPFIFPKNTLIAPKSYIVFSRQITGIALNNDKDSVRLLLPEGVVFQEVNYEKPLLGKSSARTGEGFVWSTPTPGLTNISLASINSEPTSKNFIYQQPVKSELTQESSRDYAISYQNANKPEVGGGYVTLYPEEPQNQDIKSQLATVKESVSKQSPLQLTLIVAIIIMAGFIIGILLVKFRRKKPLLIQ